ncbi:MAG: ATP-dependent helicase, partial [Phycisphaerales bacterium]
MPRGDFLSSPPPPPAQPPDDFNPLNAAGSTPPVPRRTISQAIDTDALLEGMTESQRRAVLATEGPLLVLAGPGSGKTRVITRRIAHLVSKGVAPWRILALTFTNKAAAEMRHRVQGLLGEGAAQRGLTVTTFHSLCVRLLRRYGEMAGFAERAILKSDFTVFDADDQAKLIKNVIAELNLSTANWPPRTVLSHISNAKNDLMDAEAFAAAAGDFHARTIARVFTAYQAALRTNGAADFDDLLLLTARMLRESQPVRDELRRRYRYLLVDEYQDTNRAQFVIASLLAGEDPKVAGADRPMPNICVVGDPDQSIYGWRGADITNILQFEERYPSAQVIALGENFRSRTPILVVADRLIQRNKQRKHKPLIPTRVGGDKIEIVITRDEHHEARLVADWVQRLKSDGLAPDKPLQWKDFAVFYRTNALSRVVEDAFRSAGIPYILVRGTAFFQREEIKNALGYLRVVANPSDSVSLERIINTPARGISDATWERIAVHSATTGLPTLQVCRAIESVPGLTHRAQIAVRKFLETLDSWLGVAGSTDGFMNIPGEPQRGGLAGLVDRVIKDSGLEKLY